MATKKKTPRKRRRRRRNPRKKIKALDVAAAAAGGLVAGSGAYALDGTALTTGVKTAIVGGAGGLLGLGIAMFSPALGFGLLSAGAAIATRDLLSMYMAGSGNGGNAASLQAVRSRRARMSGDPMYAQLNAVGAQDGMVDVTMSAVEAEL